MRITWIRRATGAGYELAWSRLDQRDEARAAAVVSQLSEWLTPLDRPGAPPPPQLRYPLASFYWIQSRIASEKGDPEKDAILTAKVLALTADRKIYLQDYGPLSKLRIAVLLWSPSGKVLPENLAAACGIAEELDALVPGSTAYRLIECRIKAARDHLGEDRLDMARAEIETARKTFAIANRRDSQNLNLKIVIAGADNLAAQVARQANDLPGEARAQIATAQFLAQSLRGSAVNPELADDVSVLYDGFKDFDAKALEEYDDNKKVFRLHAEIFGGLVDSLESSRPVLQKSRYFAVVAADASGRAANAYNRLELFDQGLASADRAVVAVDEARLMDQLSRFSEDADTICSAHARRVEALVGLGRTEAASSAYAALHDQCVPWLRKYPWDFYTRRHLTESAKSVGLLLAGQGRYTDALPLLQRASNWGVKEASSRLAELYREGLGVSVDLERAEALEVLAARQNIKRFTAPVDFDGTKYPFDVYLLQYAGEKRCPADRALNADEEDCAGFVGIDDQARWVKIARGGEVPDDVIESFRKLDQIAQENHVSFPDLASYAIDAAKEEDRQAKISEALAQQIDNALRQSGKTAGLVRPDSIFYSADYRDEDDPVFAPADRISRKGPAKCFGWAIRVAPEDRRIELREGYMLPAPPAQPHKVSKTSTVLDDGRKIETPLSLSAKDGVLRHGWCASPGDPLGPYRLEVYRDGALFRQFQFTMVE